MANEVFGDGMQVLDASYSGDATSSGIYSGALSTIEGVSPTDTGVILSTGAAEAFTNDSGTTDTNTAAGTGSNTTGGIDGDADLDAVSGQATFDGAILEAGFIPDGDLLTMQFVFSSEEYLEYVNGGVNDAFGVWVNGEQIDLSVGSGRVSIDTINNVTNSNLYVDNAAADDTYNTEMDGLTIVLSVKAPLNVGVRNDIKIGIADGGDSVFDSNVLIAANSVQSVALAFDDEVSLEPNSTATIAPLDNDRDLVGDGLQITQINGQDVSVDVPTTLSTGEQVTLNADGTITVQSDGDSGSNAFTYTIQDGNGTTDVGFITINTAATPTPDGYVDGTAGDDTIDVGYTGDPNGDVVDGGDRILPGVTDDDDVIRAYGGDDVVDAGVGNDSVDAGSGNDSVEGRAGDDTIDGGTGDDVLNGWEDNDSLLGGAGNDSLDGDDGDDFLDGGADNDTLIGDAGEDTLLGGDGDDSIFDSAGDDSIDAGAGDDQVFAGADNDSIQGGAGNDRLDGDTGNDTIRGDDLNGGYDVTTSGPNLIVNGSFEDLTGTTTTGFGAQGTGTIAGWTSVDPAGEFDLHNDGKGNTFATDGDYVLDMGATPENLTVYQDVAGLTSGETYQLTFDAGDVDFAPTNTVEVYFGGELIGVVDPEPGTMESFAFLVEGGAGDGSDRLQFREVGAEDVHGIQLDNIEMFAATATETGGDDTINGGAGDDDLDGGTGNDDIDGGADNDTVLGGAGNDTVSGGAGDDLVSGGTGDDTGFGGEGADTMLGGAGNDSLDGNEGADTLLGGAGNDTLNGGDEDDLVEGGAGDDSLIGEAGNDTIIGGDGADWIRGSFGEDSIEGGEGDDYLWGGFGDDTFVLENDFGNDTIEGEEAEETDGDTLDLTAITDGLTIDLTDANPEAGSVTDGTSTAEFVEIENIVLGAGDDTLTLADFGGDDFVQGFQGPTLNPDGTLTGNDMLDVSALTSDFGTTPVNALDVVVTDDGAGNAVLNFPGGESLTLVGIDPVAAANPAYLVAIGIPSNEIVDGTAGDDAMGTTYVDSEGDQTDGTDGLDDTIFGYDGDDTIDGGLGADTIDGGDDDDSIDGGAGADSILGGDGNDTIVGGSESDTIEGGIGDDSLAGGADDDTLLGGLGNDTLVLDGGDDTAEGGDGDDTFELTDVTGDSTIIGGEDGETSGDTLDLSGVTEDLTLDLTDIFPESGTVSDGANTTEFSEIETIILGAGTDTLVLGDGSGSDTVQGFEPPTVAPDGSLSGNDQLDVTGLNSDLGGTTPVNTSDVTVLDDGGNAQLVFPNGESLTLEGIDPSDVTPAFLVAIGVPPDLVVSGDDGDDTIDGTYVDDPDGDLVDSADGLDDTIEAGGGDDSIEAGAGDDLVFGEGDDDTISGGAGTNTLVGGEGDDVFLGGAGADSLVGDDGNDIVDYSGSGGAVNVDIGNGITAGGDAGNDTLGFGIEGVTGSGFDDTLLGGDSTDTNEIDGGAGDDAIDGRGGDDSLTGGTGNDTIVLGEGDDTALGGDDADTFILDSDADGDDTNTIDGGSGGVDDDTLDFSNVTGGGVTVTLSDPEDGTASWDGNAATFTEIENITASELGDTLDGGALTDGVALDGAGGDDSLIGGDGDDTLIGGTGSDTLEAGAGDDDLAGGDDADTFTGAGFGDTVDGGDGGVDDDTLDLTGTTSPGGSLQIVRDGPDSDGNGFDGRVDYFDDEGNLEGSLTFTNIENFVPCFTPGTLIKTQLGERPVESLRPGDKVLTRDNGFQTIRWVGTRKLSRAELAANPELQPVRIAADSLGPNMPEREMLVSPQHRMLLGNTQTELWFGEEEVLVAAVNMTELYGVDQMQMEEVTYVHILFDQHELVVSDNTWSESFQPGDMTLASMEHDQREELFALFPELQLGEAERHFPAARTTLKAHEARVFLLG
ncbi:Hint domain-containing protein [Roseobacteraceae bacterium S113]